MKSDAEFVYALLYRGLIGKQPIGNDAVIASFDGGDLDLPDVIAEKVDKCLTRQGSGPLMDLALAAARTYFLSRTLPEEHLVLVAFLLWGKQISPEEACSLAQLDSSNFSSMTDSARGVVLRAEAIAEEQRLGLISIGDDDAIEACLLTYCQDKGVRFSWS